MLPWPSLWRLLLIGPKVNLRILFILYTHVLGNIAFRTLSAGKYIDRPRAQRVSILSE